MFRKKEYIISLKNIFKVFKNLETYAVALTTGYILMATHMLTQIILTPIYLKTLGDEKFGMLMIYLNIITFAVFGISWFSGGLVRVLGEYWSNKEFKKFNETLLLGKYVFTFYSVTIGIISIVLFFSLKNFHYLNNIEFITLTLILLFATSFVYKSEQ